MNKTRFISLTASLVLATTFTLSCEDKDPNSFKDSRDGKTYRKVTIGSQIWMAENLNYEAEGSVCYENKPENCEKYGRLYNWATAMKFPSICNSTNCSSQIQPKHQGICPKGWHLPNKDEYEVLDNAVGGNDVAGKKLKSSSGWSGWLSDGDGDGTDEFVFSALSGGSEWWSAYEDYSGAYRRYMGDYDWANFSNDGKSNLHSVRCIQDKPAAVDSAQMVAAVSESDSKILYVLYVNDKKGLNMRSEPSTDGAKLGTLIYGEKVKVLEKSSTPVKIGEITNYWYKIEANVTLREKVYKHSWVFGGYLSENPPKESIRVIDKTCFIVIYPERDPNYVDETGDLGFYTGNALGQFEKIGIESIGIDAGGKQRYLSFVLDGGKSHLVDLKENSSDLLYKKGKKPIEIDIGTENPVGGSLQAISKYLGIKASEVMKKAEITGGYFTDSRDNKFYNMVLIGEQIWMEKNLDFSAEGSRCYGNDENNCQKYGRLYDWNTAMKACPSGWHLPSDNEWTKLKNAGGGSNQYGGYGYGNGFEKAGESDHWWSATGHSSNASLFSVRCVLD
jgi:uncharacterized protein (TIGR02145 family)